MTLSDPFAQATWAEYEREQRTGEAPIAAPNLMIFLVELASRLGAIREAAQLWWPHRHLPPSRQPLAGRALLQTLLLTSHLDLWLFAEEHGFHHHLETMYVKTDTPLPDPAQEPPEGPIVAMLMALGRMAEQVSSPSPSPVMVTTMCGALSGSLRALWWMVRGEEVAHSLQGEG